MDDETFRTYAVTFHHNGHETTIVGVQAPGPGQAVVRALAETDIDDLALAEVAVEEIRRCESCGGLGKVRVAVKWPA